MSSKLNYLTMQNLRRHRDSAPWLPSQARMSLDFGISSDILYDLLEARFPAQPVRR